MNPRKVEDPLHLAEIKDYTENSEHIIGYVPKAWSETLWIQI